MVERQARDLEVRGLNPGPVRIFLLKSKIIKRRKILERNIQ